MIGQWVTVHKAERLPDPKPRLTREKAKPTLSRGEKSHRAASAGAFVWFRIHNPQQWPQPASRVNRKTTPQETMQAFNQLLSNKIELPLQPTASEPSISSEQAPF